MEPAGTIVTEQPPNDPNFSLCDGGFVAGWQYPDYRVRCGGSAGSAGIGLYRKPIAPGYSVRVVDDPNAPDPPADGFTVTNPPPPWQLWINPVADITTDQPTADVTAQAYIQPITATCSAMLVSADDLLQWQCDVDMAADGSMTLSLADVPVGDSYHFLLRVDDRPDIATQSNDFAVSPAP